MTRVTAARPRPRRSPFPRTLRGRLIAGLMALLALGCATVGLVTYFSVQGSLNGELTSQLQTASVLASQCLNHQFAGAGPTGGVADSGSPAAPGAGGPGAGTPGTGTPSTGTPSTGTPGTGGLDAGGPGAGSPGAGAPGTGSPGPAPPGFTTCPGLGNGTLWAYRKGGTWHASLVPDQHALALSSAEKTALDSIRPARLPLPGQNATASTVYLASAGGEFEVTVISDPNGTYVTGVPLSGLNNFLRRVALTEAVVFGGVLLLAGAGGTLWVRFALRPLRRVAATASQVAELPLESGEVDLPSGVPDTDPDTETGQLGLAFNRMLGHVQFALKRRAASESRLRRFAADASHELRTPLAAIRGYAELALRHPGNAPEPVTHALGRVLSESTRMSVLVDDLLLLARLDAGRPLNAEPVDMSRLAIDATSDAQVARQGHRWVLELPDDPMLVRGDEHRLHQVLANLLANAGRHTPDGTTVTVRVSDTLPDGEPGAGPGSVGHGTLPAGPLVVLTVTDNGPGIPAGLLPELFERFTRADTSRSHTANASSTGLGLAIVDAVVAAHNGTVLVTSRPGMTRFAIALSRLGEPAPARQRYQDQARQRRPSPAHKR